MVQNLWIGFPTGVGAGLWKGGLWNVVKVQLWFPSCALRADRCEQEGSPALDLPQGKTIE